MSVKILLVDDHQMFSSSLKIMLEGNRFDVDSVNEVDLAIRFLKSVAYDIIITDIEMPKTNGIEFIKILNKDKDELKHFPKIIILTGYTKVSLFKKAHTLGVDGFLSKNASQFEFLKAINAVLSNETYFELSIYNAFLKSDLNINDIQFTARELDVLKLILEEKTTVEIADSLSISSYTVEGHRKNLLQKTNSKNVVGLIKYAIHNNLF